MMPVVVTTQLGDVPLFRRGKVRDTYDLGDRLLIIATDRVSAFDVVLPTLIPGKGFALTQLSRFWFEQTAGLVPNHMLGTDLSDLPAAVRREAAPFAGRAMLVRKAERVDVECVVRGYLAGSAWAEYRAAGTAAGEPLPPGLRKGQRLPAPLFTPAVKHDDDHDVTISSSALGDLVGDRLARRLEEASRDLYDVASELALRRGIVIADTKFEFGFVDGQLTLIDELLTPDSSRFWAAGDDEADLDRPGFDKQELRDWLERTGWDKRPPAPALPPDVVERTAARYAEAYRRLTGSPLEVDSGTGQPLRGFETHPSVDDEARAGERWLAEVVVLPKEGVNDPEGEAILGGLRGLEYRGIESVRAGRVFRVALHAASRAKAEAEVARMCDRLLANPVIEQYRVTVVALPDGTPGASQPERADE